MLSVAKNCLRPEGAPLILYEKIRRQVNGLSRKTREIYFSRNIKIGFFAKITFCENLKKNMKFFLLKLLKLVLGKKLACFYFLAYNFVKIILTKGSFPNFVSNLKQI